MLVSDEQQCVYVTHIHISAFFDDSVVKNPPSMQEMQFQSLGQEGPLEKEMSTHSSILVWGIPWTEEPGRQLSMESQRVKYDLATKSPNMQVNSESK